MDGSRAGEGAPTRLFGVLVTYRRPRDLSLTLRRLAEQEVPLARLVVVDNGRSPETADILRRFADPRSEVEHVAAAENLGPAGGIATGMERIAPHAGSDDWVVLLDDDDPPDDGWRTLFGELLAFGEDMRRADGRTAAVGLTGARLDRARGRLLRPRDAGLTGPVAVDYIGSGQLPLYLVAAVRQVGTFSPALFFGFDDLEYGLRLGEAGYRLYTPGSDWLERRRNWTGPPEPELRPSVGLGAANWRRYYSLRNHIHILRRFGETRAAARVTAVQGLLKPLANAARSPGRAWEHLRLNAAACRDGWTDRLGRTVDPEARPGAS